MHKEPLIGLCSQHLARVLRLPLQGYVLTWFLAKPEHLGRIMPDPTRMEHGTRNFKTLTFTELHTPWTVLHPRHFGGFTHVVIDEVLQLRAVSQARQ